MKVDLDALRREARGPGHEPVAVTRRYLAEIVKLLDRKPTLDVDDVEKAGLSK